MNYRRGDQQLRELRRRVEQGDVQAAERLLFMVARRGLFFVPGDDHNDRRAYWVRLLGWLKWPEAAVFQADVAAHVAPFDRASHATEWDPTGRWAKPSAVESLRSIKPFNKIGPQVAEDIGVEIMQVLGMAAARATVHLCLSTPTGEPSRSEQLEEGIRIGARHDTLNAEYREAWKPVLPESEKQAAARTYDTIQELRSRLWRLTTNFRPYGNQEVGYGSTTAQRAAHAARMAATEFLGSFGRHRSDQAKENADALFWALYALAWECESENSGGGVALQRGDPRWTHYGPRVSWSHTGGVQPSRSCMTKANRRLKAALLPSTLLAVALEVTR